MTVLCNTYIISLWVCFMHTVPQFAALILYFFQFLGIYIFGFLSLFCFFGTLIGIYLGYSKKFDLISGFGTSFFFFLIPIFVDWLIEKIDDLIDFLDYLSI